VKQNSDNGRHWRPLTSSGYISSKVNCYHQQFKLMRRAGYSFVWSSGTGQLQSFSSSCQSYSSPLDFWRQNAKDFPTLSEVARRVLCISASSAQSERDFSSVGRTMTDARSRLSPDNVESMELIRWATPAGLVAWD